MKRWCLRPQSAKHMPFVPVEKPGPQKHDLSTPLGARAHLQQLLRADSSDAKGLVKRPEGCPKAVWQYEHLRELTKDLGLLTVALNQACCEASCPVMNATDQWRFLCAAHKTPKECSAIDYALHTLEGTSAMLCSNKYFPCRFVTRPRVWRAYFNSAVAVLLAVRRSRRNRSDIFRA